MLFERHSFVSLSPRLLAWKVGSKHAPASLIRSRGVTMTTMKLKSPATIDDLLQCPKDGRKYELVDGEIVVSPTGLQHGMVVGKIVHIIATFLETSPIGVVLADNLGIHFPNGNLRSPDVTFVRNEKVPTGKSTEEF